jgi:uncharacterized protein YbbK (DUF523 family)
VERILLSRCLTGELCRWDGQMLSDDISDLLRDCEIFAICPEMDGGLSCPRPRAEIERHDGNAVLEGVARVRDEKGCDVTGNFLNGAQNALNMALKYGIRKAILKDKSPSCGVKSIYIGGVLCPGIGVTSALLKRHGVEVISSE